MKREELKEILQSAYSKAKWEKTLYFLSGSKNLLTILLEPKTVDIKSAKAKDIVSEIVQIGSLKTTDGINLPIFDVTLLDGIKIEHNRVGVNDLLKNHILKDAIKGAIVTFHYRENYNKSEWRFSFISKFGSDYFAETESIETNPKKYTYIFGTSEEHRTALERLYELQQSKFELKDFFDAFNVEPVSKDFFNNYIKFYKDFVNYLSGEELIKGKWVSVNEPSKYFDDVFNKNSIEVRNFVKRLLGRIVFLYFIQKKGWLGAKSNKYDDGNPNFLQNLFNYDNTTRDNFYNNWLSKLFFDALNNKKRKNDEFLMPNKELLFVPFLNGGLFDEVQEPKNHRTIEFPPSLFELLFNFFNGYNFTIYENSPEDHTIAVDPEMLGNIFENLLEDNKDKGAFYTPKEIVHYMAQESLIEYLSTNIKVSKELLNNLIKNHTTDGLKKDELLTIEKLVDTVKICDPAIGSGAFPMGLLQEIFSLKALLHFALNKNPDDWKPAEVKQVIIENSIYGVDIEPGAVDIARLRFWLSLVVDEPTPKPLPNLDFKIIVGNSLLSRYKLDSAIEEVFKNLNKDREKNELEPITLQTYKDCMNDYMYLSDAESKKEYKQLIKEIKDAFVTTYSNDKIKGLAKARGKYENLLRVDIFGKPVGSKTEILKAKKELQAEENNRKEAEDGLHYKDAIEWRFEFPNILDADGNYQGFDIVIGNPPYIEFKKIENSEKIKYANYLTANRKYDLFCLFIELSSNLLKNNGIHSFINPTTFLMKDFGEPLRELINRNFQILEIFDFSDYQVFDTAITYTGIFTFRKCKHDNYNFYYQKLDGKKNAKNREILFLEKKSNIYKEVSTINNDKLKEKSWVFGNVVETELLNLIEGNNQKLKTFTNYTFQGIATGKDEVFFIEEETINKLKLEKEILIPIFKGRDINKYISKWSGTYILYPYDKITNKVIKEEELRNNFPNIYNYLITNRDLLKGRSYFDKSNKQWYELWCERNYTKFQQRKIVNAEIAPENRFQIDDSGFLGNTKTFSTVLKDELILYTNSLLAILNSKLMNYYHKRIASPKAGGFFDYKTQYIQNYPIKFPKETSVLDVLVNIIIELKNKQSSKINDLVGNEEIAVFYEELIDGCVFELYFENLMKEKNIAIIDDVKQLLEKFNLLDNFQSLDEVTKNQKIWEVFKTLSNPDNKVRNKILRFPIESPDVLKIILRG